MNTQPRSTVCQMFLFVCPREQAFHLGISLTIGISNEFRVRDEAIKITILKVPRFCP